jgi:class 3 adenylate cyclase/Tfp pilus assembly protein PilF
MGRFMRFRSLIYLILCICLAPLPSFSQNIELAKVELLKEKLKSVKEDTNKVKLLESISFQYKYIDPEVGLEYGEQSLALAKKLGWDNRLNEIYNSIGSNLFVIGNFDRALKYFNLALELNLKAKNEKEIANNYGNIGNVYYNMSDFTAALGYYQKALTLDTKINNQEGIAVDLGSIGDIHSVLYEHKEAINYYNQALKIYDKMNNRRGVATTLGNIGTTYNELKQYKKALKHFEKALEIWTLFENKLGVATNLGNIANSYYNMSDYSRALEYYEKSLSINQKLGNKFGTASMMGNLGNLYLMFSRDSIIERLRSEGAEINLNKHHNIEKAISYSERAIKLANEVGTKDMLISWYTTLDKANHDMGNYEKAYHYQEMWTNIRDSIFSSEKTKEIAELEANKQRELKEKELRLKNLQISKRNNEQMLLYVGIGGFIIVLIIIMLQRRKSEKLLLNILPMKIAQRLKNNDKNIADRFENTAIVFIDIVGFTNYTEETDPSEVIASLNQIFTRFDHLAKEFGLEKIKTIGDCYMAVAGLPEPHPQPINATAMFAIRCKEAMQNYKTEDGRSLQFRIGIDFGPVVAGVIGEKKFSYDLWGDTVNTASRMESSGLPNEIQVTEAFASQLNNRDMTCEERGEIDIKGKGIVKTYLLKAVGTKQNDVVT